MKLRETSPIFAAAAVGLLLACTSGTVGGATVQQELTPTGALRVGIAVAPIATPFFATNDAATGQPRGVTVNLGTELARRLGVPVEWVTYPTAAALLEGAASGAWDVTFLTVNRERREREKRVDFGSAYFVSESTYLVRPGSPIQSIADVDHPGVRVAARIRGTPAVHLGTSLRHATLLLPGTVEEQFEMLRSSQADVIASARPVLLSLAAKLPGSRILDGHFDSVSMAVAVPRNRPAALVYVSEFIEIAKENGMVQRAFEDAGLKELIAPPAAAR